MYRERKPLARCKYRGWKRRVLLVSRKIKRKILFGQFFSADVADHSNRRGSRQRKDGLKIHVTRARHLFAANRKQWRTWTNDKFPDREDSFFPRAGAHVCVCVCPNGSLSFRFNRLENNREREKSSLSCVRFFPRQLDSRLSWKRETERQRERYAILSRFLAQRVEKVSRGKHKVARIWIGASHYG